MISFLIVGSGELCILNVRFLALCLRVFAVKTGSRIGAKQEEFNDRKDAKARRGRE